ncbi:MAG: dihydroorotate dehydrogenase [Lentimicrobium sp.]|jgi:dihydroorotate dehydrogenase (NAD+) catalytic subunit|uniref:dihydroorotate dehydrogenase n=1 Tax=Lentimicrobium sp. TaxID=2034841 RepID=UPI0025E85332|nr:dihydroorotate dehydrogenase [Lentimicrobium sp.]MCO5257099.1 dihydroorotate dehydrogenase [Lentimicrobium sp.]HPF65955.1 dihydroorotate dehydrogenase [Lentimicrobium sp.]
MPGLEVKLHKLTLKNPVLTASGTFGYGVEFDDFIDVNALGGIIVKATTSLHREGNPYPRMAETPMGMLNAVGLQNKGVDYFVENIYPKLLKYNNCVIANVSDSTVEGYVEVAEKMNRLDHIQAIELNISCPNVKEGGMAFGTSCPSASAVTRAVREVYDKTLIVKLSPNVTSIVDIALAVEEAGADAVSLINTLLGMAINAETRRPVLSTVTGGLSGPAIKPVALRMVWQVAKAVKIPVIGIGGISSATDAIEFLLAGASAVQVGTANFTDPQTTVKIIAGIEDYLRRHKIAEVKELTGGLLL